MAMRTASPRFSRGIFASSDVVGSVSFGTNEVVTSLVVIPVPALPGNQLPRTSVFVEFVAVAPGIVQLAFFRQVINTGQSVRTGCK
jgi:hypothetical protein